MSCRQEPLSEVGLERDRLRRLLDFNNSIVANLDLQQLLRAMSAGLRRIVECDFAGLALPASDGGELQLYALANPEDKSPIQEEIRIPVDGSASGAAFRNGEPLVLEPSQQIYPAIPPTAWRQLNLSTGSWKQRASDPAAFSRSSGGPWIRVVGPLSILKPNGTIRCDAY